MTSLLVRRALPEDLEDLQDLVVGELDGQIVRTAQVTWMRMLSADGGLACQVEAVRTATAMRGAARIQLTSNKERTRAHAFYEQLGYVASHLGMKKYL